MRPLCKFSRAQLEMALTAPSSVALKALATGWGFVFIISVFIFTVLPGSDPYRCRSLLRTGRWVDPADKNGDRLPFRQWQPDNCMLHQYTPDDIVQCVGNRSLVFSGDSTIRQNAEALLRLVSSPFQPSDCINRDLINIVLQLKTPEELYKNETVDYHGVWSIPFRNLTVKFIWNPFLRDQGSWDPYAEMGFSSNLTVYTEEASWYRSELEHHVLVDEQKAASLFVLGAGIWYAQPFTTKEAEMWNVLYREAVYNASGIFPNKTLDPFTAPMDLEEGMGSQLFFVPPTRGSVTGDDLIQTSLHHVEQRQIWEYQRWLRENEPDLNFNMAWALAQIVEGQNKTIVDRNITGWHYIDGVAEMRSNIMLNYRCNAKLARKNWPINATCCTDYGHKPLVQSLLVWSAMILLVACLVAETRGLLLHRSTTSFEFLNMDTGGALALPLLMSHYADRTQLMGKGEKVLQSESIVLLCIGWVIMTLLTVQRLFAPSEAAKSDRTFLSQGQMNEWRGFVLLLFISIAWANHESTHASIVMTVLGSSFLFQSAYENTVYFLATGDYSFSRIAAVLLRLNIFTCLLGHFTSTDYINYQYVLLASFFFLVVWATMASVDVKSNTDAGVAFSSIVASVVAITVTTKFTPVVRIFGFLLKIFNIHWDIELLEEHLSRDLYISYVGMLVAIAKRKLNKPLESIWTYSFGALGFIILVFYWSTWSQEGLQITTYMQLHSVASFLPILVYICLRNMSATIRNHQSTALEWVGKCSLQLYVLHFHLFLGSNSHGVLLTGAFTGDGSLVNDRWRDLIFIVPIFLLAGSLATTGTSNVIKVLLKTSSQIKSRSAIQSTILKAKDMEGSSDEEGSFESSPLEAGLRTSANDYSTHKCRIPLTKIFITTGVARGLLLLLALWTLNIFSPAPSIYRTGTAQALTRL